MRCLDLRPPVSPRVGLTTVNGEPDWLKQIWFAGNHSDVGGSYPETESRLSGISLRWMVDEARAVPGGLLVDERVLQLYPAPGGIQHDETRA